MRKLETEKETEKWIKFDQVFEIVFDEIFYTGNTQSSALKVTLFFLSKSEINLTC